MEKIRDRSMKMFWLPLALSVGITSIGALFLLIPVVGVVIYAICALVAIGMGIVVKIYEYYFFYQISLDVNEVCKGDGVETKSYFYVLALDMCTFGIYGKYWMYKVAQRLQANAPRYGFKMVIGGKEIVVLDIVSAGWISKWEFVKNMNRIAKQYNSEIGGVM